MPLPTHYPPVFAAAAAVLLDDEGGYVNHPSDPGGETRFGISKREYPELDIAHLTRADAIAIYFRDYWLKYHFDLLPDAIAGKVFDIAVDTGPSPAIRLLQKALASCGLKVGCDGAVGPATAHAARSLPPEWILAEFRVAAAAYYRALARANDRSGEFIRGWLNRAYA